MCSVCIPKPGDERNQDMHSPELKGGKNVQGRKFFDRKHIKAEQNWYVIINLFPRRGRENIRNVWVIRGMRMNRMISNKKKW